MSEGYSRYTPETLFEVMDCLASMMLGSPKFEDSSGYFPGQNIDTEFHALNEGLKNLQQHLEEKIYDQLISLSDQMRAHFEADPEDKTEDSIKGREIIIEMRKLLSEQ